MWVRADDRDHRVAGEGVEAVPIGYKGHLYLLHLGEKNRKALDELLAPWLDGVDPHRPMPIITDHPPEEPRAKTEPAKKETAGRRRVRPSRSSRDDLPLIRTWAREHGHDVTNAGRVKAHIIAAYDAAHLNGQPLA